MWRQINKYRNLYMRGSSILEPLLFLIFVNDLHKVTKYLDAMFADDTNFYSHKNLKTLFQTVHSEL